MSDRKSSEKGEVKDIKNIFKVKKQNNSSMAKIKERKTIKQHYKKHNIENKKMKA